MPVDILSELVDEKRDRVAETGEQLTAIMAEFDEAEENEKTLKADLAQIRGWSEIFDESDLETRKMIANYMIKRITVYEGYKLDIEINMNVQQFLNGLETTAKQKITSIQRCNSELLKMSKG